MAIQRLKTARLLAATDFGNTTTVIQHQTLNPIPRGGVAALTYTEFFQTMVA